MAVEAATGAAPKGPDPPVTTPSPPAVNKASVEAKASLQFLDTPKEIQALVVSFVRSLSTLAQNVLH
jgi:hypothetical protein